MNKITQTKHIIKRIYSTVTLGAGSGFHIPRCVDCAHFVCKKSVCSKYKCASWIARTDSSKCGIFANGFVYK